MKPGSQPGASRAPTDRDAPRGEFLFDSEVVLRRLDTLNRLRYRDYLRAMRASGLDVGTIGLEAEYPSLCRLPLIGELYLKSIRAVLRKPAGTFHSFQKISPGLPDDVS